MIWRGKTSLKKSKIKFIRSCRRKRSTNRIKMKYRIVLENSLTFQINLESTKSTLPKSASMMLRRRNKRQLGVAKMYSEMD